MTALIELSQIGVIVSNKTLLEAISFIIKPMQITTVIGPNGAGKSTLIKVILGLICPSSGQIIKQPNLTIGYVPQKHTFTQSLPLTTLRFLQLAMPETTKRSLFKKQPCFSRQECIEALTQVKAQQLIDQSIHQLSGGELQRVLLARALIRKPKLLVLDEPLQGVDVNGQVALYQLFEDLRQQLQCAILLVSHDLHLVMSKTDQVICLNKHICCMGQPESVSQNPHYQQLINSSFIIPATMPPMIQENKELSYATPQITPTNLSIDPHIAVYQHHHDHHHNHCGTPVPIDSKKNTNLEHSLPQKGKQND